jgi:predicted flap endonuclease-1-like 5' DNA nuclease
MPHSHILPGGASVYALQLLSEEGPNTSLSWLLWIALLFFFLMVVVGWLTSRNKGGKPEVQHEAYKAPEMPVAYETSVDNLTVLEGIGPKVAKVLNGIGIASFVDLAGADAAKVQEALNAAGMQMMNPEGWIEQARLAAAGDTEGLAKLQDELKGGRRH